ncbi:pyridoxamine 5'-phosphate oxidase family protein [Candidatus Dojkabacteria bacterium]|uniref:Pyridoxamine 5'-phosphate oxidase family protein n=1 Tax=Candidatus Dojkabacteria bacterium TaxID=2099670 RepID=A0A955L1S2_9BACT|nr:pyridoxamine 5'-phosphate oxidase family protein [Candidatus Dojkabacteria bacterium]
MEHEEIIQRAKNFLATQRIASLATAKDNYPWIVDLFYVADESYNLYFLISKNSKTWSNIEENKNVAVTIDAHASDASRQKNIQVKGTAQTLSKEELESVIDSFEVAFPDLVDENDSVSDFKGKDSEDRFIKITPENIFFRDSEAFEGRHEIVLS